VNDGAGDPPNAGAVGTASEGGPGGSQDQTVQAIPLAALEPLSLVEWFAGTLSAKAYECLGHAPDVRGRVGRDLEGARVAIDALNALIPVLEGRVPTDRAARLRALVADVRLTYVKEVGQSRNPRPSEAARDEAVRSAERRATGKERSTRPCADGQET